MKIVLNRCYGGFSLSKHAKDYINFDTNKFDEDYRTSAKLIEFMEQYGEEFGGESHSKLRIVEIPDEATDWEINDYDGYESIIYVIDGKLKHI